MSLIFRYPGYPNIFDDMEQLERRMERLPQWNAQAKQEEIVDDEKKFGVSLDVAQFKPEELKVNLDGRVLAVEGRHESKDEHSCTQRSFTRKWLLPENIDLAAVRSQLDDKGHLQIEAPKIAGPTARNITIEKK